MVSNAPGCDHVVKILDWFDDPDSYKLILERPDSCMNLQEYRDHNVLPERVAQGILRQVVQAARHCCDNGVFHRDIKEENLLISLPNLEVKLVDFGCGDLLKSTPYRTYSGNCSSQLSGSTSHRWKRSHRKVECNFSLSLSLFYRHHVLCPTWIYQEWEISWPQCNSLESGGFVIRFSEWNDAIREQEADHWYIPILQNWSIWGWENACHSHKVHLHTSKNYSWTLLFNFSKG